MSEHEHEGKLSMKIAYIENEKAQVRQWYRILARLSGDKLQVTVLKNETEEVRIQFQFLFLLKLKPFLLL